MESAGFRTRRRRLVRRPPSGSEPAVPAGSVLFCYVMFVCFFFYKILRFLVCSGLAGGSPSRHNGAEAGDYTKTKFAHGTEHATTFYTTYFGYFDFKVS